ncbi:MAG: GNAT family N-acetyltransferase [Clostridiales bacterium]|nr:GNAT family N-acetyltransferase [Clostridiales bacterium]
MVLIRHERAPVDGQPTKNTFCAIDGRTGAVLGSSVLYEDLNPMLYPARPLLVRIQTDGDELPDVLMGATIARAYQICQEHGEYARIFTRCAPDEQALLQHFKPFGLEDNDGLVRMQLDLPCLIHARLPDGVRIEHDRLEDMLERRSFLMRYNQLFNVERDRTWLDQFTARKGFMRLMALQGGVMAGEVLFWREGDIGVIGFIQTERRWRRHGIGTALIQRACDQLEQHGLARAECNIRVRYPHMLHLLQKAGFEQAEVLMHYPGIDLDPE